MKIVTAQIHLHRSNKTYGDALERELRIKYASCDCWPLCTDITYKIASSQTDWNWTHGLEGSILAALARLGKPGTVYSRVTAYFEDSGFIASERNELYGPMDFLANFGGLVGLFTGASVISVLEIGYHLFLRFYRKSSSLDISPPTPKAKPKPKPKESNEML